MTGIPRTAGVEPADDAIRIRQLEAELAEARERIAELEGAAILEYGQQSSGGGYLTWLTGGEFEQIYPLAHRIEFGQRFGGKVGRRRIVVLEDWKNLRKGAKQ